MTATNHSVTGIAIAVAIHNPIALPLALAAHFIEDAIPHSYLKLKEIWADVIFSVLLSVGLTIYLRHDVSPWFVLGCAFLCASPDLIWGWRMFKLKDFKKLLIEPMSWFSRWHQKIQWSETRPGIVLEIAWLIGLLVFIIKLR